jgi:hypothetical protein
MSWDDDYSRGRGPGGRFYPSTDLTDEAQFLGLDPRQGDESPLFRAGRPWGRVVELRQGQRQAPIATEVFIRPVVFAIRLRFSQSADGPFSPRVPSTYGGDIEVRVIESFDLKSGEAIETFALSAALVAPVCKVLARSITVTIAIASTGPLPENDPGPLFVQAVAAPLFDVECEEVTGAGSYASAVVTRVAANTASTELLAANQLRKQFIIVNNATPNLYIKFGLNASLTPGSESFSVLLTTGQRYEAPIGGYGGLVTGIWASSDASGEALITEGF